MSVELVWNDLNNYYMCAFLKDKVYVYTVLWVYHLITDQPWLLLKAAAATAVDDDEIFINIVLHFTIKSMIRLRKYIISNINSLTTKAPKCGMPIIKFVFFFLLGRT